MDEENHYQYTELPAIFAEYIEVQDVITTTTDEVQDIIPKIWKQ
jgi:hypothetical protein